MYLLINLCRKGIIVYLNAFPTPWTYERDALADHTIWFYLSFPTRPFNIVPIWARNIQAGRLCVFSDCHSGIISCGCDKFNLIEAIGVLNFSSLRYWILEHFPNFNVAYFIYIENCATRCVITHKSAVLSRYPAEAWHHSFILLTVQRTFSCKKIVCQYDRVRSEVPCVVWFTKLSSAQLSSCPHSTVIDVNTEEKPTNAKCICHWFARNREKWVCYSKNHTKVTDGCRKPKDIYRVYGGRTVWCRGFPAERNISHAQCLCVSK